MKKTNSIVPEFMIENNSDSFKFLLPLNLKIDKENYANSYFNVLVRNLTRNEDFITPLSPELFFTNYSFRRIYKNGKLDTSYGTKNRLLSQPYTINTNFIDTSYNMKLSDIIDDKSVLFLLENKGDFTSRIKNISCCLITTNKGTKLIIPHYAIASYYYYRSTSLREAVLSCKLDNLYINCDSDPENSTIVIPKDTNLSDTPFIHRFVCQNEAENRFESIGNHINTSPIQDISAIYSPNLCCRIF